MVVARARQLAIVFAIAVALWSATVAGAHAALQVALPADATVAAAAGHALWATESPDRTIVVMSADLSGSAPVKLAAVPEVHHTGDTEVALAANAAGYLLVVRDVRQEFVGDPVGSVGVAVGDEVIEGGYDGATSVLARCVPHDQPEEVYDVPRVAAAANATWFAYAGVDCTEGTGVHVVGLTGAVSALVPVSHDATDFLLSGGGSLFAFYTADVPLTTVDLSQSPPRTLVTARAPAGIDGIAVGADGTLALAVSGSGLTGDPLSVRPAAASAFHRLVGAVADPQPGQTLATDSGRLLYTTDAGYQTVLASLTGGAPVSLTPPRAGFPLAVVNLSGDQAVVTSHGCLHDGLQLDVLDAGAPPVNPDQVGCPISYDGKVKTLRVGARGVLALPLRCTYGCAISQVLLDLVPGTLPRRTINAFSDGVADPVFSLRPGAGIVHVHLDRQALRLLAAHPAGVPIDLDPTTPGPPATLVHSYRLRILPPHINKRRVASRRPRRRPRTAG